MENLPSINSIGSNSSFVANPSVERIKLDRNKKKRLGTTIITNLNKFNNVNNDSNSEEDENLRQIREYGELLKEIISYGEKVINNNEQTIDIMNEMQIKQSASNVLEIMLSRQDTQKKEIQDIINLIQNFLKHIEERITLSKSIQKYNQQPNTQNPGLGMLKGISMSFNKKQQVKGLSSAKSKFQQQAQQQSSNEKQTQPESTESSSNQPQQQEEETKKNEEKKSVRIMGSKSLNQRLQQKNSLQKNNDSPKNQQDSPKNQFDSPKSQFDSPKSQFDSPKDSQDSPKIYEDSPKIYQDSPKIQQDSPQVLKTQKQIQKPQIVESNNLQKIGQQVEAIQEDEGEQNDSPLLNSEANSQKQRKIQSIFNYQKNNQPDDNKDQELKNDKKSHKMLSTLKNFEIKKKEQQEKQQQQEKQKEQQPNLIQQMRNTQQIILEDKSESDSSLEENPNDSSGEILLKQFMEDEKYNNDESDIDLPAYIILLQQRQENEQKSLKKSSFYYNYNNQEIIEQQQKVIEPPPKPVETYYLDMPDFQAYNIINEKGYYSDSEFVKLDAQKKKDQLSIGFKDFEFIKLLGQGAYGYVYLVKKKNTNDLYAMKIIDTSGKLDKKFVETLISEKNVFELISGDWVVKAYYSFTHENYICFVLEYMMGGDFSKILNTYTCLDQWIAEIYMAELVLAIEYLHQINIVHRDLKPDNMLIDQMGHLKLADFGLSEVGFNTKLNLHKQKNQHEEKQQLINIEQNIENEYSTEIKVEGGITKKQQKHEEKRIVGTPDYIAPEIIMGESTNNKTLDWWSMGIIMYEFLVGIPPFNDDTVEKIFENIKSMNITWPEIGDIEDGDKISPEAADLMKKLLNPNYKERLGARGVDEIKAHPFFKNISWNKLRNIKAPIKPTSKQLQEAINKREKDKEQMQQFMNKLKSKEGNKLNDEMGKKLNEELKNLERLDLFVNKNNEEADQLLEEQNNKITFIQKQIQKYSKIQEKFNFNEKVCYLDDIFYQFD